MIRLPVSLCLVVAAAVLLAAPCLRGDEKEKAPEIKVRLEKGGAAEYVVKREGSSTGETPRGEFKSKEESEVAFRIEVAERKEGGDLTLKVTLPRVKAAIEDRDSPWEFDSSKPDSGGEAGPYLREVLAKPITVAVKEGRIAEIMGLPEPPSAEGGQGNFRLYRARAVLGRDALRRELALILASSVQGKALEKGKEYRAETGEERREGARQERGRRFGGREAPPAYRFEGEEKAGAARAARFKLTPTLAERPDGQAAGEIKGEGKALVSLEDGLLLSLDLTSESKTESERDGQKSRFQRSSKVRIERKDAAAAAPAKARTEV